jgi:hypothetical protein
MLSAPEITSLQWVDNIGIFGAAVGATAPDAPTSSTRSSNPAHKK